MYPQPSKTLWPPYLTTKINLTSKIPFFKQGSNSFNYKKGLDYNWTCVASLP